MDPNFYFILTAAFGAFAQEVIYWYDLRKKIGNKRLEKLRKSTSYWVVTALMIVVSAIGAWLLYGDSEIPRNLQFLMGAAFPLIFKKLVDAVSDVDQTNLGYSPLKDYFQLYSFSRQEAESVRAE